MDSPEFRLIMQTGPTPGEVFVLTGTEVNIGRETSNEIAINDVEISRRHARMVPQGDGYLFQDLGSTNGSFIDGKRLMGPHFLQPGEVITLGQNVRLLYEVSQRSVTTDPDATLVTPPQTGLPLSDSPVSGHPLSGPPQSGYRETAQPAAQTYVPSQARPLPPAPPPIYAEDVSQQPVEAYPAMEEEPSRGIDVRWLVAGCGCLTIASCAALAAFFYWVDIGGVARWCQFFGFLFPACP